MASDLLTDDLSLAERDLRDPLLRRWTAFMCDPKPDLRMHLSELAGQPECVEITHDAKHVNESQSESLAIRRHQAQRFPDNESPSSRLRSDR